MGSGVFSEIKDSLRHLYQQDDRPWLVGYSGGKAESDETPSSANSTTVRALYNLYANASNGECPIPIDTEHPRQYELRYILLEPQPLLPFCIVR